MVDPNTIMIFDLKFRYDDMQIYGATFREEHALHEFALRQYKTHTRDFEAAFDEAVHKRVKH